MSTVLGIDFRTANLDLVYLDENDEFARWHHIATRPGIPGARDIPELLPHTGELENHGVYLIAIEQPMGQNRNAIAALHRIQGAILATLPTDLNLWTFRPDEWKRGIGLRGNAPKQHVQAWALEHGASIDWTGDACDALALAYAAREINAEAVRLALITAA